MDKVTDVYETLIVTRKVNKNVVMIWGIRLIMAG